MAIIGLSIIAISTISYFIYKATSSGPESVWWTQHRRWRWYSRFLGRRARGTTPDDDATTANEEVKQERQLLAPAVVIVGGDDENDDLDEKQGTLENGAVPGEDDQGAKLDFSADGKSSNGSPSLGSSTRDGRQAEARKAMPPPPVPYRRDAGPAGQEQPQKREPPPSSSTARNSSPSQLMPPPPRPQASQSSVRGSRLGATSPRANINQLRPRTSGLLPPPSLGSSLRPITASLTSSGNANLGARGQNSRSPNKPKGRPVVLEPGHSPLDWARLINSGADLRGLPSTIPSPDTLFIPPSVLRQHNRRDDAWTVLAGKVYNITPYLPYHPGGQAELMRAAGRDGTQLFMEIHAWVSWDSMLRNCLVGKISTEEEAAAAAAARVVPSSHSKRVPQQEASNTAIHASEDEDEEEESGSTTPTKYSFTTDSLHVSNTIPRAGGGNGSGGGGGDAQNDAAHDNNDDDDDDEDAGSILSDSYNNKARGARKKGIIDVRWDEMD